jgi:putative ABC transport system ATP-binding protein
MTERGKFVLNATGVHKWFGATHALRGPDLAVRAGEVVALMGPPGAGKSALMQCAGGVLPVDAGSVVLAETHLSGLGESARANFRLHNVGFVFQHSRLIPELTCLRNVMLVPLLQGAARRDARTAAMRSLRRVGADAIADHRARQVSASQAQLVAIARAIVGRTAVVFADEPTRGLGSASGDQVMDTLCGITRETASALVFATHEPRVAAYSDREVVLRDGCLVRTSQWI